MRHAAARQDRHDHARQPPGRRVPPGARRRPSSELAERAHCCRASPTRRPRAARSSCSPRSSYGMRAARRSPAPTLVPFTAQTRMSGVDLDGRSIRKGAADSVRALGRGAGRHGARSSSTTIVDGIAGRRRHAARRRRANGGRRVLGVIYLKDIVKAGHARALRRAAAHGHPHGDDHRRQPAHRRGDRRRRPASTTSSPRRRPRTRWR